MNQRRYENFILLLVTLGSIALTIENIMMGWEFWVTPLIVLGTAFLWIFDLSGKPDFNVRKEYYLIYTMLTIFYYGIHETSLFDVTAIIVLIMVAFSYFDKRYMMNMFFIEFISIVTIQVVMAIVNNTMEFDLLNISRLFLHVAVIFLTYVFSVKTIKDRRKVLDSVRTKDEQIEAYNADMEDFLSNISHELRTPVNVVNGMSDLMMKKNAGSEISAIKDAGVRLAYQIEDIQDYTECKRKKVMLEEDDYLTASMVNDLVTSFRSLDNKQLQLVVDLAPSMPMKLNGDIKKIQKIFRHLLENAVKFTKKGGIYVKIYSENTDYGINMCIEMTDTGIGMDRKAIASVSEGMYQVNKKRNRSSGGIGLGLFIVYGFAHIMGGFVKIESDKKTGTMVRVTIPQKVVDETPCLSIDGEFSGDVLFHVRSDKYQVPKVRDFYRDMASNLATGMRTPLYYAETIKDIERLKERLNVTYIFMGQEEYEQNPEYFDALADEDITIAVSSNERFRPTAGSKVRVMPKPIFAYPVMKTLNEGKMGGNAAYLQSSSKISFKGLRALIVDDEPMNLVVATSIFSDYQILIDTAESGKEALLKYRNNEYDVIFMDHMMPEMDGVETMKKIRKAAKDTYKTIAVIALTANTVSGAKEMFMKEGFDGFISKPINTADFERVMLRVFPVYRNEKGGRRDR